MRSTGLNQLKPVCHPSWVSGLVEGEEMQVKTKRLSDLNLSAFLSVSGHKLLGVEGNGRQGFFVFEDTPELERDTLKFFNRETTVDALSFGEALRNLKALALSHR